MKEKFITGTWLGKEGKSVTKMKIDYMGSKQLSTCISSSNFLNEMRYRTIQESVKLQETAKFLVFELLLPQPEMVFR